MRRIVMKSMFFALGLYFASISVVAADAPWNWKMSLQNTEQRDKMFLPTSLYTDAERARYYVVDSGRNRLVSYDEQGKFLSSFTASNRLQTPFDIVREEGFLWIIEKGKNSVTFIDLEAKKIVPNTITYQGKKVYPHRLEKEKEVLYILDKASGSVLSMNKNMEVERQYGCDGCAAGFVDFKVSNNRIWALAQQEKEVHVFNAEAGLEQKIVLAPEHLEFPISLEKDAAGLIYILDRHQGNISVFDGKGQYKYSFLESGQARGQLYYPIEIHFDPWGNLCVVEEGNGRVQIFSRK